MAGPADTPAELDLVIETAGKPAAVEGAIALARRGGRVVLLGLAGNGVKAGLPIDDVVNNDLVITASFGYTSAAWAEVAGLLRAGRIQLAPLITRGCPTRSGPPPTAPSAKPSAPAARSSSRSTRSDVNESPWLRELVDLGAVRVLTFVGPESGAGADGGQESSRRNGARMGRVSVSDPRAGDVRTAGVGVQFREFGASGKTVSARATTETVRVGRLTEIFDTPLPANPAQAGVVAGFRADTIVWDQSQDGLASASRVMAYVTGDALQNLADADVYMKRGKIVPGGTDRLFKTRVTMVSAMSATITTCDDGSKFELVNPSTGVPDPADAAPEDQQYGFETWQMVRLDGLWVLSSVLPVNLPDPRAKPCQP
jgi:hypothetical protein